MFSAKKLEKESKIAQITSRYIY